MIGYLGLQALLSVVVGCALSLFMILPLAITQDRAVRLLREQALPRGGAEPARARLEEAPSAD